MDQLLDYNKIAKLFVYPQYDGFKEDVKAAQSYLNEALPSAASILQPFTDVVCNVTRIELEDLYLRSFEVQSITTLDIGYVAFGDDYKRGELLVNLNAEHSTYNIDCGTELADNLSNVLMLLYVMENKELRNDLVNKLLAPALDKMIAGFGDDQIKAKDKVYIKHHKTLLDKHKSFTIYKQALLALFHVLNHDFEIKKEEQHERSLGFLGSIKQEITIES